MNKWTDKALKGSVPKDQWKKHVAFRKNPDGTCHMLSWVGDDSDFGFEDSVCFWAPNDTFEATMRINSIQRVGRSSVEMNMTDLEGNSYSTHLSECKNVIDHSVNGVVSGIWIFERKGPSWGMRLVRGAEE